MFHFSVDTYGAESPVSWYTVFKSKSSSYNHLRRYISHDLPFPLPESFRVRRSALVSKNEEIQVTIGENMTCIKDDENNIHMVCNGPLAPGVSYRFVYVR